MNEEIWNELGNIYFLTGHYQPAIHAYARSIENDNNFGRSYSNLALAYVQTGRYLDAIEIYHRSLQLLHDDMEKAITWNRLGILYRLVKDYHSAVIAYEQADQLDPHQDEKCEEAARNAKYPLYTPMPHIDLSALLRPSMDEQPADAQPVAEAETPVEETTPLEPRPEPGSLAEAEPAAEVETPVAEVEVNAELEDAEESLQPIQWYEGDFVPPNPVIAKDAPEFPAPDFSVIEAEIPAEEMAAEGWILIDHEQDAAEDDFSAVWGAEFTKTLNSTETVEVQTEVIRVFEDQTEPVQEYREEQERREIDTESMQVTGPHPVEYSQTIYPLGGLSDEEVYEIESDITRYKQIIQRNPRNAFAWDMLGDLYKKINRFKQAIIAYQKAISIESGRAPYHYKLGVVYSISGRDEDALDAFERALLLEPTHTFANASLANHYLKQGLNDLAERHIEIALQGARDENEYNRACLEALCGNTDRAFELLQIAMEDQPSNISWAQIDPDLAALRADERFPLLVQSFAKILEEE